MHALFKCDVLRDHVLTPKVLADLMGCLAVNSLEVSRLSALPSSTNSPSISNHNGRKSTINNSDRSLGVEDGTWFGPVARPKEVLAALAKANEALGLSFPGDAERALAGLRVSFCGLFPIHNLMNHSCVPNTRPHSALEGRSDTIVIVAAKPIEKGDEVLCSYAPPALSASETRAFLSAKYGFDCRVNSAILIRKVEASRIVNGLIDYSIVYCVCSALDAAQMTRANSPAVRVNGGRQSSSGRWLSNCGLAASNN